VKPLNQGAVDLIYDASPRLIFHPFFNQEATELRKFQPSRCELPRCQEGCSLENSYQAISDSPSKHFDELLIARLVDAGRMIEIFADDRVDRDPVTRQTLPDNPW
jgi:hypothetical protein